MKNEFQDTLLYIHTFVTEHYYYYSGVLMRVFIDNKKWSFNSILSYISVSIILVDITKLLLEKYNMPTGAILLTCCIVGFCGHTGLRYFLDDFIIDLFKEIKIKVLNFIRNK